ncbi:Siroheme synthase [uncultured Ruminococcus sp.]|uniref:precorrin-2 dehydrogenase/sirohydrochlorin ferrochelatase family protein n=1 Tax=Huintestinicola butyrica TaxID=2981728 RepID=UPI0008220B7B|nr:bifunctional precorrin-2 dehydrogenase/sirohydrochlorin ferrochelatase [Huintestinicola butyrica]MCU6726860.1 bifunctional precorrin-2 dehydrogenase/sirohydrochlorin ferrochelatase [Huintestinicola butyrica]SCI63096.1 Siroheme synthase [uncultured Ruminococcus sp.]
MGYFPFFIEIGGKKCVVAGGGAAALRRINTLVKFGPQITVIAPAIMSEISSMDSVTCIARPFEDSDIEGAFMVVAATDDLLTNMRIAELCKEKNIPAEAVGSREGSGFLFPDVAMKNGITIGISIADKGPVIPSEIREKAESLISEYDSGEEEFIRKYRRFLMEWISDEHERKNMLKVILKLYKSGADETEILKFIEIAR